MVDHAAEVFDVDMEPAPPPPLDALSLALSLLSSQCQQLLAAVQAASLSSPRSSGLSSGPNIPKASSSPPTSAGPAAAAPDDELARLEQRCSTSVEQLQLLLQRQGDVQAQVQQHARLGLPPELREEASSASSRVQGILDSAMAELGDLGIRLHEALEELSQSSRPTTPPRPPPAPATVLAYAHKLRYTTFAHLGLTSLPPAPQPFQLINSMLFR